ncbi:MAG TPA: glycosyltransferase [Xanthobacteraceae bacterium]|nr:glycosyltransferase [Xanthobacteraceae bacterium]
MSTASPAISVLIPVWHAVRFLPAALDSVLAQTFADFEVIAIDDGTHDGSADVLAAFAARDRRIRVMRQENQGIVASLNRAVDLARAPFVARMDHDDVSRPDRFAKQLAYLRLHPEVAAVSGAMDVIDQDGAYLRTEAAPTLPAAVASELLYRNCICHPAVMARTEALRKVGGYRKNAQFAEDYDLWLRLSEIGGVANLPDVLLSYRLHPVRMSTQGYIVQELAVLAARGAARQRRRGNPDPLASTDAEFPLGYREVQRMFEGVIPRAEFAFSFFQTVLGKTAEIGSIRDWARLYLRHGLGDLDGYGAAMMLMLLGHIMRRRRRAGVRLSEVAPYPFWAMVTAIRHPIAALDVAVRLPHWLQLARTGLLQPTSSTI